MASPHTILTLKALPPFVVLNGENEQDAVPVGLRRLANQKPFSVPVAKNPICPLKMSPDKAGVRRFCPTNVRTWQCAEVRDAVVRRLQLHFRVQLVIAEGVIPTGTVTEDDGVGG